jgi:ABC-2 type transport system ATP-binding protein
MSNAIELRGVGYSPGDDFEIRDMSLHVPDGSIYGFLGPNGSGKTTTIRLFMGMLRPERGEILVLGRQVPREIPTVLKSVGYVPERPHLYPALTVIEHLRYHAAFFRRWDWPWAHELLDRLGLLPHGKVGKMSKGETGKLLILMALAQRPKLLVLDEPTDGLDPVVRRDVLSAVLDYVSDSGATVFISSHLVHELERFCDWVGVLDHGSLIAELPMQSFKDGIKRIRVQGAPAAPGETPFILLSRQQVNGMGSGEVWIVRGWHRRMTGYFDGIGARVQEIQDLDLEEGFVELLRSSRL